MLYTDRTVGHLLPLLLFSCGTPTPSKGVADVTVDDSVFEDDSGVVDPVGQQFRFERRDILREPLGNCISASVVYDYQHLCSTEDGLFLENEHDASSVRLGGYETHSSGRLPNGDVVMALDGGLYTLDGQSLVEVDMDLPVPVQRVVTGKNELWLWGMGELFRWDGGSVSQISLPEYPYIYDFAASEDRLYLSLPWLAVVDLSGDGLRTMYVDERMPTSMAVDSSANLWFVSDNQLFLRRPMETIRPIELPEAVRTVAGPEIWVEGESSLYRYHSASFSRHTVSGDGIVAVDGYGRLLQIQDGQLFRRSIGRPIVVVGLSESIFVREAARLLPSDPASVSALHAWVNDEQLDVTGPPWTIVVEPDRFRDGLHDLRFFSESELGDSLDVFPLWIGELPEVEWAEIAALSDEHCIACHGGATLTDLSTKNGWEQRIDEIIAQVSDQEMPLGGPYLTDDEITLIRGWKNGGFQ